MSDLTERLDRTLQYLAQLHDRIDTHLLEQTRLIRQACDSLRGIEQSLFASSVANIFTADPRTEQELAEAVAHAQALRRIEGGRA